MSGIQPTSPSSWGVSVNSSSMLRAAPTPRSSLGSWEQTTANVIGGAANTALNIGAAIGTAGEFTPLLLQQIQLQRELQYVSMYSNILKSKHETEMAPIRNMRVG